MEAPIQLQDHLPVEATLDRCIKCNNCVSFCPVANVTDLFPGPKYEGPQAARFRAPDEFSPDHSVDYCSGCRMCNMVCPTGVKIAEINARARAKMYKDHGVRSVRNWFVARPDLLGTLGSPTAPVANTMLKLKPMRWMIDKVMKIDQHAPMPPFSFGTFRGWFKSVKPPFTSTRKVVYFHGCSTQHYEPWVGQAAVAVLEHNGIEVILSDQNCCGLPALSNGQFDTAKDYHCNNVRKMLPWVKQGYDIVGTSTSCTLTLQEEAPELLDLYDEDTRLVSQHTYDIFEYLLMLHEKGELNTAFRPVNKVVPYHPPCQLRAHRMGLPAIEVLSLIPGLAIHQSNAACCGIAGTYGLKTEKYKIAQAVGQPLFDWAKAEGQPLIACDSETCRWQITASTGIESVHPIALLKEAYGI